MVNCYKIFDLCPDNKSYRFLYHGVNKNRNVPFNTWIKSERKWAGEGGNKYWTGFHVFVSMDVCKRYYKRFVDKTKTRVIVKCVGKNLQPKESSRGNVFLAEEIMVKDKV